MTWMNETNQLELYCFCVFSLFLLIYCEFFFYRSVVFPPVFFAVFFCSSAVFDLPVCSFAPSLTPTEYVRLWTACTANCSLDCTAVRVVFYVLSNSLPCNLFLGALWQQYHLFIHLWCIRATPWMKWFMGVTPAEGGTTRTTTTVLLIKTI